uniref:Uncharacterized protein n=1 Tax=Stomoxys calcitrans TaxID=35570 RepID=A0A1I8PEN0_STOCA
MRLYNLLLWQILILVLRAKWVKTLDKFPALNNNNEAGYTQIFKDFLYDRQLSFDNCIIFGPTTIVEEFDVIVFLAKDMEKIILFPSQPPPGCICYNCLKLNENFLVLIFWQTHYEMDFLEDLSQTLEAKRQTRILIIFPEGYEQMYNIFRKCLQLKMINVVLILLDSFKGLQQYQGFQIFPQLKMEKHTLNTSNPKEIFPNKMKNLYGHAIRMIPDQISPRSVVYRNKQGDLRVDGYLIPFFKMFASHHNATLQYPNDMKENSMLLFKDALRMAEEDKFDILAGLVPVLYASEVPFMSYLYEAKPWCLMIPQEPPYTYRDFLNYHLTDRSKLFPYLTTILVSILMELSTKVWSLQRNVSHAISIRNLCLHPKVWSGILGWTFNQLPNPNKSMKILYAVIFIRGLLVCVQFTASLQSFLTHPLTNRIRTYKDLEKSQIKVLTLRSDYDFIAQSPAVSHKYNTNLLEMMDDVETYLQLHASFNTTYAYHVYYPQWFIYDSQQKHLKRPIFYLSNICIHKMGLMAFILGSNSYFLQPLNVRILRSHEMGLLDHWLKSTYYELKQIGKIHDLSENNTAIGVTILGSNEFLSIWMWMGKWYMAGLICFVGELFYDYILQRFQCVKKLKKFLTLFKSKCCK